MRALLSKAGSLFFTPLKLVILHLGLAVSVYFPFHIVKEYEEGQGRRLMTRKHGQPNGVSIITSTNRPRFFNQLIRNYNAQQYQPKQLIIILNKDSMNLDKYRMIARKFRNISVFQVPEKVSLGRCLNYAIRKSSYPYIAKFDDDDYYSPHYLTEQIKAIRRSGADLVGKRAHFSYLEASSKLVLRFPKQQSRFTGLVAGGTILLKRKVFRRVRFANVSLGEDTTYLRQCRARGYRIFSASPYNYVAIRRKDKKSHTWKAADHYILSGSRQVATTKRYQRYAIRRV
jgi:glycosyltransferase involved in cell wall biosynthesis